MGDNAAAPTLSAPSTQDSVFNEKPPTASPEMGENAAEFGASAKSTARPLQVDTQPGDSSCDKKRTYSNYLEKEKPKLPDTKFQRTTDDNSEAKLREEDVEDVNSADVVKTVDGHAGGSLPMDIQQVSANVPILPPPMQQPNLSEVAQNSQIVSIDQASSRPGTHQNGADLHSDIYVSAHDSKLISPPPSQLEVKLPSRVKKPSPVATPAVSASPTPTSNGQILTSSKASMKKDAVVGSDHQHHNVSPEAGYNGASEDYSSGSEYPDTDDSTQEQELNPDLRNNLISEEDENTLTPEGLAVDLYTHQKSALAWMMRMEKSKKKGGILADDMGLGKTITTLALVLAHPAPLDSHSNRDPTLIIAPVALIKQWAREATSKVKRSQHLKVYSAHDSSFRRSYRQLRSYDIVLTTYDKIRAEAVALEKYTKSKADKHGRLDPAELSMRFPFMSPISKFHRIILDEAQHVKNRNAKRSKAICQLVSKHRWCLTGTPMMNDPFELGSLIKFLRIKPYDDEERFRKAFGCLVRGKGGRSNYYGSPEDALKQLKGLTQSIMLRRTKQTEMRNGQPIIPLPPKSEEIDYVVFSPEEESYYRELEKNSQIEFKAFLKSGLYGKSITLALVLLLRLRQACCHPFLNFGQLELLTDEEVSLKTMKEQVAKMKPEVITQLCETASFQCSKCLDAAEKPIIIPSCGHTICSACFDHMKLTAEEKKEAGQDEGQGYEITTCPTCNEQFELQKAVTYDAFQQVHMAEKWASEHLDDASGDKSRHESPENMTSRSKSQPHERTHRTRRLFNDKEVDERGNLKDFVVDDDHEDLDYYNGESDEDFDEDDEISEQPEFKVENSLYAALEHLRKKAGSNVDAHNRYLKHLKNEWVDSAKITRCKEIMAEIRDSGEKTIVFSQWNLLLNLLEVPIRELGVGYRFYTGGMSPKLRDGAVSDFSTNPDVKVMLVSLKAGNAGLNLTCASHVIIMDPFWNPFIESQAIDRAYRIGQTKPVKVHRILVKDTVEDRIRSLQDRKRGLVEAALDENSAQGLSRLGADEMAFLFGVSKK